MGDGNAGIQKQIDALSSRQDTARGDIDANRADIDGLHKTGHVDRSDIDRLQIGAEVDRHLIAELQADGLLRAEHTAQLEAALKTARVIGSAIGLVMAARGCTQEQAFQVLVKISKDTNRKLREVANDLVRTGSVPSV